MTNPPFDIVNALKLAHEQHQAGRLQQAETLYRAVLAADPGNSQAYFLLGLLAQQHGQHQQAAELIAQAVLRDDNNSVYLHQLGLVLATLGQSDSAVVAFEQVLAINPRHADAHNSRGLVLLGQGKPGAALGAFEHALASDPKFAEAHNNRGNALEALGRNSEAQAAYRQALALAPDFAGAHSNLLLCMQYDAGTDAQTIFNAHLQWQARHAAALSGAVAPHTNTLDRLRRLRIGYVSPDFCRHPVAAFIEPLLATHDQHAFEIFCYSNAVREDEVTQRLRKLVGNWRSISSMPDAHVAELVRKDCIDILVDLAGHTAGQRLLVFARKPAPIQVTYLGYPGTSGLSVMDYRLTDTWLDPPGTSEGLYSETLVRLPGGSLCWQAPAASPAVTPLPALRPGNVTFASFNNAAKISPEVVALWSQVLKAVPDARMLLKSKSFGDSACVARLTTLFAQQGIVRERFEFISWIPASTAHLALYQRAHIALDTFPYSGCTTTCEALWMGVPVITLASDEPRSRMSVGILSQTGLTDCIAQSPAAYINKAQELANDMEQLQHLRSNLRATMQQSFLLDAAGFTRQIETVYKDLWQHHVTKNSSGSE